MDWQSLSPARAPTRALGTESTHQLFLARRGLPVLESVRIEAGLADRLDGETWIRFFDGIEDSRGAPFWPAWVRSGGPEAGARAADTVDSPPVYCPTRGDCLERVRACLARGTPVLLHPCDEPYWHGWFRTERDAAMPSAKGAVRDFRSGREASFVVRGGFHENVEIRGDSALASRIRAEGMHRMLGAWALAIDSAFGSRIEGDWVFGRSGFRLIGARPSFGLQPRRLPGPIARVERSLLMEQARVRALAPPPPRRASPEATRAEPIAPPADLDRAEPSKPGRPPPAFARLRVRCAAMFSEAATSASAARACLRWLRREDQVLREVRSRRDPFLAREADGESARIARALIGWVLREGAADFELALFGCEEERLPASRRRLLAMRELRLEVCRLPLGRFAERWVAARVIAWRRFRRLASRLESRGSSIPPFSLPSRGSSA